MERLTCVIPFWNGHATLPALLESIPHDLPVVVVNDAESVPPERECANYANVRLVNLERRGYFSGACNAGFAEAGTDDVLVLNQDGALLPGWEQALAERERYGLIGDGVFGHPAWPRGYIQGTFMFIRRDVLKTVGDFNTALYPLWGATCEYQLRACRRGFEALPLDAAPYYRHRERAAGARYGSAITATLVEAPEQKRRFIRTPPEISVIVPTYNFVDYLGQAVASVLEQTFQSTEIIIADDGSTDATPKVGAALADPWQGVHYLRFEHRGLCATLNAAIAQAHGRYVTVLSADDWMAPQRLARLHALIEAHPHSVIYDDVIFAYPDREVPMRMADYDFEKLLYRNMMHAGILYPKAAWQEVGGYSEEMSDGREDWEFNLRLGLRGWCGVHLPEPLYYYRRQGQGRTERAPVPRAKFEARLRQLHPQVYERGERPMGCCGKRKTGMSVRTTGPMATPPAYPKGVTSETSGAGVVLEYIGQNIANQTICGPSGTCYKYGRNARYLRVWVRAADVDFMLGTRLFKRVIPQRAPEPQPTTQKVAEEPQAEPEDAQESAPASAPVIASRRAQELAEHYGLDLDDIPHTGSRVLLRDVQEYLDAMGVAV